MKISEILKEKKSFSFEVFPPKNEQPMEPLIETLDELAKFNPDFISVTYGAGGTNKGRNNEVCMEILKRNIGLMSHFTCIGNSKEDVLTRVSKYREMGGENLLALRGDLPEGWEGTRGHYTHGNLLIEALKESFPEICLAGACYPEKHLEAETIEEDILYMKSKQDKGAEFFVSQLCFDIEAYARFLDLCEKGGITKPIIVGFMPVLNKNGIVRMTSENGCAVPAKLQNLLDKYGDNPEEFKKAGKEYSMELLWDYINLGVDGLHLYSLNKYKDLSDIIIGSDILSAFK